MMYDKIGSAAKSKAPEAAVTMSGDGNQGAIVFLRIIDNGLSRSAG